MKLIITNHAINRYRERIADVPDEEAVAAIIAVYLGAKEKYRRRINRGRNTTIIPHPDCTLICSRHLVVSVIKSCRASS